MIGHMVSFGAVKERGVGQAGNGTARGVVRDWTEIRKGESFGAGRERGVVKGRVGWTRPRKSMGRGRTHIGKSTRAGQGSFGEVIRIDERRPDRFGTVDGSRDGA